MGLPWLVDKPLRWALCQRWGKIKGVAMTDALAGTLGALFDKYTPEQVKTILTAIPEIDFRGMNAAQIVAAIQHGIATFPGYTPPVGEPGERNPPTGGSGVTDHR